MPLEPTGGAIAANFVMAERVPVLIDLLKMDEDEMVLFARDFGRRLLAKNRDALHVFLDEADIFAPQTVQKGSRDTRGVPAECLRAWQHIMKRGRTRGLGLTVITHRSASINKELITQADPLFVHRLTHPLDLAVVESHLKYHGQTRDEIKSIIAQITRLKVGEAFVISSGTLAIAPHKVSIYQRKSFDSSATPKPGEKRRQPRALADVDLGALRQSMADTIERAKADDPRELRKTIATLERKLKTSKPFSDQPAIDRAVNVAVAGRDKYWLALVDERDGKLAEGCERFDKIKTLCDLNGQLALTKIEPPALPRIGPPGSVRQTVETQVKPRVANDLSARPDSSITDGQPLPRGERAILTVCAQYPQGAERDQITVLTGYKKSTRDAYLQRLREKGPIETPLGEPIRPTQAGIDAVGEFDC